MAVYLMSIKPKFGEEILGGAKKCELRKLVGPLIQPDDVVYLYFTKPTAAVVGYFTAGLVFIVPTHNLSKLLSELGGCGVGEEDLKYVEGARYSMLIEARGPARCLTPVKLTEIGLRPPPSYRKLDGKTAAKLKALCEGKKI
ncbi:conserved hypothetical protein [Pyrobaculum islandicum DSM 4184]|uniref:ASCH domain-containing protein n=1 Tax=Pyrobaculum islandicum (strain DSM 4184 / JCM 9189 / GEO3) TaxID=384616 RepID=A1RQJ3_PYRIL|nr:hypothetical protein [Pyrobaculum islandicum]ABL87225.1 conserved hypothetical protein [Pyrobaculum islandicum DSM 4184]